jgi:hypothetical protein
VSSASPKPSRLNLTLLTSGRESSTLLSGVTSLSVRRVYVVHVGGGEGGCIANSSFHTILLYLAEWR